MDVILTGLPRSGLTAVSALIDSLPDSVCLNSPAWQPTQRGKYKEPMVFSKWLAGDFLMRRAQLLRGEPVPDWRALDGTPLLDGTRDARQPRDEAGKRIPFMLTRKNLSKNFTLAMKHHMLYTALLPTLAQFDHFKIIAVIRHPYDVINSWWGLQGRPISEERIAAVQWPQAENIAYAKDDVLDRMIQLYDLHLGVYHSLRDKITILKYEDVAEDPLVVSKLFGHSEPAGAAQMIDPPRRTRSGDIEDLRERFKMHGMFTKQYYRDI